MVKYEISKLCSKRADSLLRSKCKDNISLFPWDSLRDEMLLHCPTLYNLLFCATTTKTKRVNQDKLITVIISMLCKFRSSSMSLLQRMISLLLYAAHSGTIVYDRLQKLMFCVSKNTTVALVHYMGCDFNKLVLEWKQTIIPMSQIVLEPEVTDNECSSFVLSNEDDFCDDEDNPVLAEDLKRPDDNESVHEVNSNHDLIIDFAIEDSDTYSSCCKSPSFSSLSTTPDIQLSIDENDDMTIDSYPWNGYVIVGDNLDMNVHTRYKRIDSHTQSYHYFHSYAVKERLNLHNFSDLPPSYLLTPVNELPLNDLLPSVSDNQTLIHNFSILVSRILVSEFKYFEDTFGDVVMKHIHHDFYSEMKMKSEVVPLGVITKNENIVEEMMEIALELSDTYTPTKPNQVIDKATQRVVEKDDIHAILFAGDQLTRKRLETAKEMSRNSTTTLKRLNGILPICTDWHTKRVFLEVIWKRFYDTKSMMDKGTLYQLRCAIDRRNVSASSEDDYNSCDDFFVTIVTCYVIAAAMKHFNMTSVDDTPLHDALGPETWMSSNEERASILTAVCKEIVISYGAKFISETHDDIDEEAETNNDKVLIYSTELLSYGLLYNEYSDAIREGDGLRVLRCWRYLMLIFKAHQRKNYSIESLLLLSQYHFFFTERQCQQLLWSRFINVHGIPGRNISLDLHMEHLNRVCKIAVANLGANKTSEGTKRVSKCVGILSEVQHNFDKELGVHQISGHHGIPGTKKDKSVILKQLLDNEVFTDSGNRSFKCFSNIKSNPIASLKEKNMHDWIVKHITNFKNKMYLFN